MLLSRASAEQVNSWIAGHTLAGARKDAICVGIFPDIISSAAETIQSLLAFSFFDL